MPIRLSVAHLEYILFYHSGHPVISEYTVSLNIIFQHPVALMYLFIVLFSFRL
jgi:hypothetical protein